ncbi:hypothetical protein DWX10_22185 [Clostridium sp. AF18-27]|nr:hypothetical protein DWX10_22185 [Clostridium sp. AF18-27]
MIGTEACDWRIVESTTGSAPWIRADRLGTQFFAYPGYFIGNNGPPAQPAALAGCNGRRQWLDENLTMSPNKRRNQE